jgi:Poxvirus Late Transcription Factor VLTF3 like
MSLFKYKPPKKIILDERSITTLDSKHKELQGEFQYIQDTIIPELENERNSLKERLRILKNGGGTSHVSNSIPDYTVDKPEHNDSPEEQEQKTENKHANKPKSTLEECLEIRDRIKEITATIKKHQQDYKNYYLNNSEYIFEYFETKKTITSGGSMKTKSLNAFFNLPEAKKTEELFKNQHNNVEKYMSSIDQNYMDVSKYVYSTDICQFCRQGEMIPIESEGIMVCNKCSKQVVFLIDNEKPSYKEPPKEACFYAYKRINHFREILAQFQAKETTSIPEHVLESIKQQIKKERIEISQFTDKKAKEIMKKLGFNKYYEHIPFIKDKLGIKPPVMTPDLEERLCNLFMEIQGPYAKFCPDDRVNFLNYYYTVYKLCELLGRTEFLPFFPMLKDREKRIEQDQIWKQICLEFDWEFIPTP